MFILLFARTMWWCIDIVTHYMITKIIINNSKGDRISLIHILKSDCIVFGCSHWHANCSIIIVVFKEMEGIMVMSIKFLTVICLCCLLWFTYSFTEIRRHFVKMPNLFIISCGSSYSAIHHRTAHASCTRFILFSDQIRFVHIM